jgi:phosphoribosyl-AMP cyclohydrolase
MDDADFERLLAEIRFSGSDALIPAIAQQHDSGKVLMLAWMNRDALRETMETGRACYWSRSRQRLWRKGETSGQVQKVLAVSLDCDGDTILLSVDQTGVACHTGRPSCFFRRAEAGAWSETEAPSVDPAKLYGAPEIG